MRRLCMVALSVLVSFQAYGQSGVEVGDIDRGADPCTDFFQFANGAWRAKNPIPDYMGRWSRRWAAGEANKDHLKEILEETARRTDWPKGSAEELIGDFYGGCMDEASANQLGAKPLKPLLAQIDAIASTADLQRMLRGFHDIAILVPFAVFSSSDNHDPTSVIANVAANGLGLPDRDYYLKPDDRFKDAREKYRAHVAAMLVLTGYAKPAAAAAADVVMRIETDLAKSSLDNVALRDPQATDHKTHFADLQKLAPHFDWVAYFDGAKIAKVDLNVSEPKFLEEVDRQLVKTSLKDWKTYLRWQLVHSAADSLSDAFVAENFAFFGKYLDGTKEMKPRWKRCVEPTDQLLGEALGKKYVERYFPPEAKARMLDMTKNLLLAMKQTIEGLTWMAPSTKQKALEKLSTINVKIGYPDKWKDYSSVTIDRKSYWSSVLAARRWNVDEDRGLIGKPLDRGRWGLTPPTSDAYYSAQLNEIVFPAGILQPPAFNVKAVDAVNYGAIGVVIGHEVSHGFDDEGAQFDAQGRLQNWWTDADLKQFQERGQCVVNQFEGYFIEPGIHHNGKLVLGESIGDLAGAKIAHLAYELSQKGKPPAQTIDGFTPEQQFFIAWAQFRGDETRPETQRKMVQGDPHPVAKYRVIGPFSNSPAFQKAFACKDGAPMVRPAKDRCEVW